LIVESCDDRAALLEFCRDHDDDVLRFTTDTRIWSTNNISGGSPDSRPRGVSLRCTG
jgi:hypothetical protein